MLSHLICVSVKRITRMPILAAIHLSHCTGPVKWVLCPGTLPWVMWYWWRVTCQSLLQLVGVLVRALYVHSGWSGRVCVSGLVCVCLCALVPLFPFLASPLSTSLPLPLLLSPSSPSIPPLPFPPFPFPSIPLPSLPSLLLPFPPSPFPSLPPPPLPSFYGTVGS